MCLLPTANEHIEGRVRRDWTHFHVHQSSLPWGFKTGFPSCTAVDDLSSLAHVSGTV